GVPPFSFGIERWTLVSKRDYYYLMAVLVAGALFLTARLLGSRVGRALAAIQSNESLAESSGISAYAHTMLAMVVSCVLAGVAGNVSSPSTAACAAPPFCMSASPRGPRARGGGGGGGGGPAARGCVPVGHVGRRALAR